MTDATPPVQTDTGGSGTPTPQSAAPAAPTPNPAPNPNPAPTPAPDPANPNPAAPNPTPTPGSAQFAIPDAYKDKPWAAKVTSQEDLWKQIENLQGLAGKKAIVPNLAEATPEAREDFYKAMRPENVEAYGLKDVPDSVLMPAVRDAIGEQMLAQGISPVQAKPILEAVAKASDLEAAKLYEPANFQAEAEKVLGAGYDPKPLNAIIKSNLSAEAYAGINALPNVQLVAMHRAIGEIVKQYGIKENAAHVGAGSGGVTPPDIDAQRAGLRKQIGDLRNKPHTEADKKALTDKLAETYKNAPPSFAPKAQ